METKQKIRERIAKNNMRIGALTLAIEAKSALLRHVNITFRHIHPEKVEGIMMAMDMIDEKLCGIGVCDD